MPVVATLKTFDLGAQQRAFLLLQRQMVEEVSHQYLNAESSSPGNGTCYYTSLDFSNALQISKRLRRTKPKRIGALLLSKQNMFLDL